MNTIKAEAGRVVPVLRDDLAGVLEAAEAQQEALATLIKRLSATLPEPEPVEPSFASVQRPTRSVLINVKLDERTAIAMAKRAASEGLTQKQWPARVLQKAGLPVHPADLEDRRPPRRVDA